MENDYKGYFNLTDDQAAQFYETGTLDIQPPENSYIILGNEVYCYQSQKYRRVKYPTISNNWCGEIKPLDAQQTAAIDMLQDRTSTIKIISGKFGSGKDFLMFNEALSLIGEDKFDRIVYLRPNHTLKNVPDIGYLPDSAEKKLAWTMGPLYDKVGGSQGIDMLTQRGKLELMPLLFIRGCSFDNSIIYVSEAQNIDTQTAGVLVSRVGKNSELWMNGDIRQVDKEIFKKDNGFGRMVEKLSGEKLFSYLYLPNTHRSETSKLANLLFDD